jgi:hypothetical protein
LPGAVRRRPSNRFSMLNPQKVSTLSYSDAGRFPTVTRLNREQGKLRELESATRKLARV